MRWPRVRTSYLALPLMRQPRARQAYRYIQRPAAALASAEGAAEDGCRMVAVPAVPTPDPAAGCAADRRASVQRGAP